jgi:hypothetical protein
MDSMLISKTVMYCNVNVMSGEGNLPLLFLLLVYDVMGNTLKFYICIALNGEKRGSYGRRNVGKGFFPE